MGGLEVLDSLMAFCQLTHENTKTAWHVTRGFHLKSMLRDSATRGLYPGGVDGRNQRTHMFVCIGKPGTSPKSTKPDARILSGDFKEPILEPYDVRKKDDRALIDICLEKAIRKFGIPFFQSESSARMTRYRIPLQCSGATEYV